MKSPILTKSEIEALLDCPVSQNPEVKRVMESKRRVAQLAHLPDARLAGEISTVLLRRQREFSEAADILGEVVYRLAHGKRILRHPSHLSHEPF